jgi:hypothetical protein
LTTLLDEHDALVVRCDQCRRLWPVTRQRLAEVWELDEARDVHRCPVCVHPWRGDAATGTGLFTPGPQYQ